MNHGPGRLLPNGDEAGRGGEKKQLAYDRYRQANMTRRCMIQLYGCSLCAGGVEEEEEGMAMNCCIKTNLRGRR